MIDDGLVDDFAIRSFRDVADEDYISARMAFRAALVTPSLWASQQALEKYLKCILLLKRIPAKRVRHNLILALEAIKTSGKLLIDLTPPTLSFIKYLDELGPYRYLEISNLAFSHDLIRLDRAVWELRRYCTSSKFPQQIRFQQGVTPPKIRIGGGYLEAVMDNTKSPARKPLLWQNAFFGARQRRLLKVGGWMKSSNAPLYLNPQILDEVLKYVYLPKDIIMGYRAHTKPH